MFLHIMTELYLNIVSFDVSPRYYLFIYFKERERERVDRAHSNQICKIRTYRYEIISPVNF